MNWDEKNPKDIESSKRFLDFIGEVLREKFEARGWRFVFLFFFFDFRDCSWGFVGGSLASPKLSGLRRSERKRGDDLNEYLLTSVNRWEFSVLQTSKELWRIQGLEPPSMGSEAMELWKREGNAVPYKL